MKRRIEFQTILKRREVLWFSVINIIIKFHRILNREELDGWMKWFNNDRINLGVKDYPANLYVKY